MIQNLAKKIMLTGITKYAKELETNNESVQIKITDNPEGMVYFDICNEMKTYKRVSFLNIMDKKLDLLGYEAISTPFLKKILESMAKSKDIELPNASVFIFCYKNDIVLGLYNQTKNVLTMSLSKAFDTFGV